MRIINFKPSRYSVNPLYNKCEILKFGDSIKLSNFLYAHDNIKGNLPTTLCAGITLLDSKHSQITRNQKGNQVNIPTCRIPLCNSYLSVMFVTDGIQNLSRTEKSLRVQKVWKLLPC